MNEIFLRITVSALVTIVVACGPIRNKPEKTAAATESLVLTGGSCGADLKVPEGSQGLFAIRNVKDYDKGEVEVVATGFITTAPLAKDVDAYDIAGLRFRPVVAKKKERKDYSKLFARGNAIPVSFGDKVVAIQSGADARALVRAAVSAKEEEVDESADLTLEQSASGLYKARSSLPIESLPQASAGTDEGVQSDVKPVRSLVMRSLKVGKAELGVAASFPANVEAAGKELVDEAAVTSAQVGKDLVVPVAPDTKAANVIGSVITVFVQQKVDEGKDPSWRAICTAADGSEVKVPTDKFKEGLAEVTVLRRRLSQVPDGSKAASAALEQTEGDSGAETKKAAGPIYIETASGVRTTIEVAPKPTATPTP